MTIAEMRAAIGAGDDISDLDVVALYAQQFGNPAAFVAPVIAAPAPVLTPEQSALAALHDAFAEVEPIIYRIDGADFPPFRAVKMNEGARDISGTGGGNLRRITWEIHHAALPRRPRNADSFTHGGRRWQITEVEDRDDVGAWWVTVADGGAA